MVFVKTEWGGFHKPPYTDEENWEFEQRLRRGGGITIIHQRQPDHPEPLPERSTHGAPVVEEEHVRDIIRSNETEEKWKKFL